ncbi:MAG: inositol monophosphatase family protein [Endozoicomonas sp. (ex Botrylloides leachii)]|nr:inositol monophosphatase family protein [Endozoicomonas sp. (ex Botrylloides leachii)]
MQPMVNMALRAARAAGEIITRAFADLDKLKIETKNRNDFVTEVDKASEQTIISALSKAYPDHGFYGEESGYHLGKGAGNDYQWIIDPLDGTTNFIRGIPQFAISIACQYRGRLEHAVVIDPIKNEEYCASRGYGATLNSKRIRVSNRKSLEGALIGTGIPFMEPSIHHLDNYLNMMRALLGDTAGIRRAGAAALDLAYVASGRLDAFWEIGLKKYDMAAGALLIQEAGGLVSDFKGGSDFMNTGQVVCGSPRCFKEVLQRIHPFVVETMNH